jgi:general secretion pathway protein L
VAAAPSAPIPSAIEFTADELRLKGLDAASAGLSGISARLQAQGYSARLDGDTLVMKQERMP